PGKRAKCAFLGKEVRARRVVCGSPKHCAGPEDPPSDRDLRRQGTRRQRCWACDDARVPRPHSREHGSMMTRYLVIGAGGYAQEVAWSLDEQTRAGGHRCEFIFFDDGLPPGPLPSGLGEVAGTLDAVAAHRRGADTRLVLGIGLPRTKSAVV